MKNGFTLIEVMVLMAIIGILFTIAIPAITGDNDNQSKTSETDVNYYKDTEVESSYLRLDKRSTDTVTLKRHSDGQLYACDSDELCKKVIR